MVLVCTLSGGVSSEWTRDIKVSTVTQHSNKSALPIFSCTLVYTGGLSYPVSMAISRLGYLYIILANIFPKCSHTQTNSMYLCEGDCLLPTFSGL